MCFVYYYVSKINRKLCVLFIFTFAHHAAINMLLFILFIANYTTINVFLFIFCQLYKVICVLINFANDTTIYVVLKIYFNLYFQQRN